MLEVQEMYTRQTKITTQQSTAKIFLFEYCCGVGCLIKCLLYGYIMDIEVKRVDIKQSQKQNYGVVYKYDIMCGFQY